MNTSQRNYRSEARIKGGWTAYYMRMVARYTEEANGWRWMAAKCSGSGSDDAAQHCLERVRQLDLQCEKAVESAVEKAKQAWHYAALSERVASKNRVS